MNITSTVSQLKRSAKGEEFITASELKRCLGCGNEIADSILSGLDYIKFGGDRATKRYLIEEVAHKLLESKVAG